DLASELRKLRGAHSWTVKRGTEVILHVESSPGGETALASEGEFVLAHTPRAAGVQLFRWLPGICWAMTAGTAFLMLVIYGLLLRLVLRPVDNLVAASRGLSKGVRPPKVTGESRTDEMGELIRAFNSMAEEVVTGRDALRELVEKATADYRRAHEQLVIEQRLSATGKLAAGVAHEISNPLGGMINAARAIEKEEGLSERAREYVGLINDGLARVRDIVERMRTFVRPKPAVGPVDVAEAVKGALSFARHRVKDEGVELDEDYPTDPAAAARTVGDAGELQQVFLNLVMNALDAVKESDTKRVRVRVACEEGRVVAEIADTGSGMTPERLANAFDLFYSTKDMSAEGEGGTGLGLAIAHKIVTDHGGEIELESSPGEGTVARVRLPVEGERE
ncbi:MAG: sensor histidine kinase, partial [Planctomycetota bacterium]